MKHPEETEAVEIEALGIELLEVVAENTRKNKIETTLSAETRLNPISWIPTGCT